MLRHVFQVNGEQEKRGKFKETVNMLKVYVSENFRKDVSAMESLFGDEIKKPKIDEPDEPKVKRGRRNYQSREKKYMMQRY